MLKFDYDYSTERDAMRNLGLIVLKSDETIEHEFRSLIPHDEFVLHTTRIESDPVVTSQTLQLMEQRIPQSVSLLPEAPTFDVVAYACTSGATTIGPHKVSQAVNSILPNVKVTDPLTAIIARLNDVGARKIGLLTPYIPSVTDAMIEKLSQAGIDIAVAGSFYEANEEKVVRIAPASVHAAAVKLADSAHFDALFISCTNLPTLDILSQVQKRIGVPVFSSNSALAWHMIKLAANR